MRFTLIILILFYFNYGAMAKQLKVKDGPTFTKADFVEYDALGDYIYAFGNIQIITDEYIITADKVIYDIEKDTLLAQNKVKITDKKNQVIHGQAVYFKDKFKKGIIKNFIVKFPDNSILASRLASRIDENRSNLCNSNFSPCRTTNGRKPIWQISAKNTDIDLEKQNVVYNNVFFKVYGLPVFYTPYFAHPLPGANAQSGILVPTLKKDGLVIPIYFRLKNNIDATISPRIAKKYLIYEGELRHKIDNGQYVINGSYGKVPYTIKNSNGEITKKTNVGSYYLFANGHFSQNHYNYGFNLAKTSDRAYLKNYYNLYNSYLTSKIYLNKVEYYDYLKLDGMYFQGLKADDNYGSNSLILPRAKTKNIFDLDDDETMHLIIDNDALIYNQPRQKQLGRESLQLSLDKQHTSSYGHLLNLKTIVRNDFYLINKPKHRELQAKTIPELSAAWRLPLVGMMSDMSFSLEPIIVSNIGLNFKKNYNKYALIDAGKFELTEDNLFKSNHFGGIDYHEYGKRIAYGLNSGLLKNNKYITFFIGQLHYKHNNIAANSTGETVGRAAVDFDDKFSLFYKFRKNKGYEPIRDELGFSYFNEYLKFTSSYIKLQNLSKYYSSDNEFNFIKNQAQQAYYDIEYKLTPNLTLGNELRFDLTSKKTPLLYRSIRMTYVYDCVSISTKFYDDYMSDSIRGIKKTNTKTIAIGLKVLNM